MTRGRDKDDEQLGLFGQANKAQATAKPQTSRRAPPKDPPAPTAAAPPTPPKSGLAAPIRPAVSPPDKEAAEAEILTVASLDRLVKRLLESNTTGVRVQGEISGLHRAGSGHCYFTLKDETEDAVIDCVMYRSASARARHLLEDGESVVLVGRVTIYAPRGRMQFVADDVLQTGRGALLAALEKLKAKLAAEGLFDPERKQPLPADCRNIAVLTSRDGAAIHDVVRVASRRARTRILLIPTPVQGSGAADRIAAAIQMADKLPNIDVLLVTRGGGSAEDLAAYNDEQVVRAIAAATHPVVSAVGHEIDVSLSDLVADARAATPSQAAELLVPDDRARQASLNHLGARLRGLIEHRLTAASQRLNRLETGLGEPRRRLLEQGQRFDELVARLERNSHRQARARRQWLGDHQRRLAAKHPRAVLATARGQLNTFEPRLLAAMESCLTTARRRADGHSQRLHAMSPLAVLSRGYAIATSVDGGVLRDARELTVGDALSIRLHQGRVHARVEQSEWADGDTSSPAKGE